MSGWQRIEDLARMAGLQARLSDGALGPPVHLDARPLTAMSVEAAGTTPDELFAAFDFFLPGFDPWDLDDRFRGDPRVMLLGFAACGGPLLRLELMCRADDAGSDPADARAWLEAVLVNMSSCVLAEAARDLDRRNGKGRQVTAQDTDGAFGRAEHDGSVGWGEKTCSSGPAWMDEEQDNPTTRPWHSPAPAAARPALTRLLRQYQLGPCDEETALLWRDGGELLPEGVLVLPDPEFTGPQRLVAVDWLARRGLTPGLLEHLCGPPGGLHGQVPAEAAQADAAVVVEALADGASGAALRRAFPYSAETGELSVSSIAGWAQELGVGDPWAVRLADAALFVPQCRLEAGGENAFEVDVWSLAVQRAAAWAAARPVGMPRARWERGAPRWHAAGIGPAEAAAWPSGTGPSAGALGVMSGLV